MVSDIFSRRNKKSKGIRIMGVVIQLIGRLRMQAFKGKNLETSMIAIEQKTFVMTKTRHLENCQESIGRYT
jgi:hypothetical protein